MEGFSISLLDRETAAFIPAENDEAKYSIWPALRELPAGRHAVGKSGTKEECCAFLDEIWTDMRPRSVRARAGFP
jgi:MbtH protein